MPARSPPGSVTTGALNGDGRTGAHGNTEPARAGRVVASQHSNVQAGRLQRANRCLRIADKPV
jgi:hypothetical protein